MGDGHMVGRERELRRGLDAAARVGCTGVVIVGPAGVGKSTLALSLATRLAAGSELLRISGTPSASGIPLGAVAPLLAVRTAPTTQADLIRHTVAALADRAVASARLTVLIDDAHLLDDASATLVHQLALTGSTFLVVTVRALEPVPDPITALWKDGLADRLDLAELGLAETTALAQAMLGGGLQPAAASTLFTASAGNPLFFQQLVVSARDAGVLALVAGRGPVAGGWQLVGPLPLPADLISAVEDRLEHLDDEDRAVIELVALGEPIGAAVLETLSGANADVRLERLEAQGLIVAELSRRRLDVRLAHPMYGEVLRARMPTSWANRARVLLADAIEARGLKRRDDALRVAMWRLDARARIPSTIAHAAARQALHRFDAGLAERIVRQSEARLTETHGTGETDGDPATAMAPEDRLLLATIAARASRPLAALDELDGLDRTLDTIPHDGHVRSLITVLRFDVYTYLLGRYEEAFALEVPPDGDRSIGAALTARKAVVLVTLGQPGFADSLLADLPELRPGTRQDVWVSLARAMIAAARGQVSEALSMADRVEASFETTGWDPSLPDPVIVSYLRLRAMQQQGQLAEASALAAQGADRARDRWSEQAAAWCGMASASLLRMQGRPLAAAEEARASAAIFERAGSIQLAGVALAELAAACATAGDGPGAVAAAEHGDDIGVVNFYSRYAHAWAVVGSGRITDGVALLIEVLASRRRREAREELLLMLDIVGLGGARDVLDAVRDLAAASDGELAATTLAYATAAADDHAEGLVEASDRLAGLGCALAAAEAAVAACAARLRAADRRRARPLAELATSRAAQLDAVRLPSLQPPEVRALLAPREREVATLAAAGHTSPAISELIGLSQRTVESYIQNAFDKLGVSSRSALAELLG